MDGVQHRRAAIRVAWLREAASALRACRDLAKRLEALGRSPEGLDAIRTRIACALLELDSLGDRRH